MEDKKDKIIHVPVEDILPNRFQPRLAFNEKELNELAKSIIKYGVIQPIVLRNIGDKYEIIAGERRYKASVLAGLKEIPAILNNADDNTSAEIALLENLQRKNLTPIEEAQSYKKLLDRGFTQEEIASKLGISQSSIANKIRLLSLPNKVREALLYGRISERHARSLISLNNVDLQNNLLDKIILEKLTVKQTEEEVSLILNGLKEVNDIPEDIQKYINNNENVDKEIEPIINEKPNEDFDNLIEEPVDNITESVNEEDEKLKELLKPEPPRPVEKNEIDEFFDIKVPAVVTIDESSKKVELKELVNNEIDDSINPFQDIKEPMEMNISNNDYISQPTSHESNNNDDNMFEPVNYENKINEYNNIESSNIENNNVIATPITTSQKIEDEPIREEKNDSLLDEDGEPDLPKIINKVRDFVGGMNEISNLISTSEVDFDDKYQIIIEINKDTM